MVRGHPVSIQLSYLELRQCEVTMFSDYVQSTAALKELSLVQLGLKGVEIIALFKALESSKTVEVLKLEVNTLYIRGALQFAKLQQNNTLRSATLQKAEMQAGRAS
ncbi:hypothetical protein V5799_017654 [Amblyomma americanum]|uniref:Uncharacterized protein n=1 Tax=Amblyomma americanum TaxID=6943 RepID=A0AAQ4F2M1_AMBAM